MRWIPSRGGRLLLTLVVFGPPACLERECGSREHECESDGGCPEGSLCLELVDGCGDVGRRCVAATPCASDADCADGEPCVVRDGASARHPFERSVDERGVCGCDGDGACESFATAGGGGAPPSGDEGSGGVTGQGGAPSTAVDSDGAEGAS